ncbi:MAG TPA: tetratricopeptide repeat protein, partial [Verrucomicrobium sp.]|nr:tetratricopeptide repeat protein [Verrucomicrobium sp.]
MSRLLVIAAVFALGTALAIKAWPTADSGAKPKGIVTTGLASPAAVASVAIVDPVQALLDTLPKVSTNSSASEKALQEAASQVKKRPQDAVYLVNLGDAIAQRLRETSDPGLYSLALLSYQQALARSPSLPDAMTGIAWVYGGQHAFPQSVEWANRALKVDPGNPAAQGLLGDAALELGDYEEALVSYQKMMDARPDLSSWSRGAYLLWINGDRNRAKMLMEKAIRAGGPFAENTSWCRARLAMMAFHEGAYLPAAQALDVPLRASTTNTHVLLAAARIACALQDLQTGAEYFERVLKNGPHIEALAGLGDIAQAKGDATGAEGFYQKVLDLHAYNVTHGVHDHMAMAKFYADHDRNPVEAVRLAEQHKDS